MRMLYRCLAVVAVAVLAASAAQAQDFESIPATELRDQPQRYWARGFVVHDVLVAHAGQDARKIGDRKTFPFRTEILGDCYVDHQLRDVLNSLELGKPYLFAGTVYQERRGLFSRDLRYTIVIKRISAGMDESAGLAQRLAAEAAARGPYAETFAAMDRVLTAAQQDLLAYAASSNVAMEALFEAGSPHAARVTQAVRQSLTRNEIDSKVPMIEFLARIMTGLLAARNGALAPEPVTDAAPEAAPAEETPESAEQTDAGAAAEVTPALVAEPVGEAPVEPESTPVAIEGEPVVDAIPADELEAMDREAAAAARDSSEEPLTATVLPVVVPLEEPAPEPAPEAVIVEATPSDEATEPPVSEIDEPATEPSSASPEPLLENEAEAETESPVPAARLPPARIDINAPLPIR